jgi:signal transduction histidine kinase
LPPDYLLAVFGDTLLLDAHFCITGAGRLVEAILHYHPHELVGKPVDLIGSGPGLESSLRDQLRKGFFKDQAYTLRTRSGHVLPVSLSGFYAPAAGAAGQAVLKVKGIGESHLLYRQLEEKTLELEQFLYRASHDLRGPLATVMGLAQVAMLETVPPEQFFYLEQILKHSEKLDDTLKNLLYMASSGDLADECPDALSMEQVENLLRDVIALHGSDQVEFIFQVEKLQAGQVQELGLVVLFKNVLAALLELPRQAPRPHIMILVTVIDTHLLINVFASGFKLDDALVNQFRKNHLSCSEVLHSRSLVHHYVVRKILRKVGGTLEVFLSKKNQHLFIRIPLAAEKADGN